MKYSYDLTIPTSAESVRGLFAPVTDNTGNAGTRKDHGPPKGLCPSRALARGCDGSTYKEGPVKVHVFVALIKS